jgi:hypothetical protein
MQEHLSNKIDAQRVTSATTSDYITQLVTGRATLSLNINNNDGSPSTSSTFSPPSQQQQQTQPQSSPQQPPPYQMSRGIKTVTDLYRKRNDRLAGGHSVESFGATLGCQMATRRKREVLQQAPLHHSYHQKVRRRT